MCGGETADRGSLFQQHDPCWVDLRYPPGQGKAGDARAKHQDGRAAFQARRQLGNRTRFETRLPIPRRTGFRIPGRAYLQMVLTKQVEFEAKLKWAWRRGAESKCGGKGGFGLVFVAGQQEPASARSRSKYNAGQPPSEQGISTTSSSNMNVKPPVAKFRTSAIVACPSGDAIIASKSARVSAYSPTIM